MRTCLIDKLANIHIEKEKYVFFASQDIKKYCFNPFGKVLNRKCRECGNTIVEYFDHKTSCTNRFCDFDYEWEATVDSFTEVFSSRIELFTEITDYKYQVGEVVHINDYDVRIKSIAREPATGNYEIHVDYPMEPLIDEQSKSSAEMMLEKWKAKQQSIVVKVDENAKMKEKEMKSHNNDSKDTDYNAILVGGMFAVIICLLVWLFCVLN